MLKLIADDVWTYLHGNFPNRTIDDVTSYKVHGRWMARSFRQGQWDGIKRFREFDRRKKCYRFPTGFLNRVCKELDKIDYPYVLDDSSRSVLDPTPVYQLEGVDLSAGKYSYQAELLDEALLHGRGVIKAATGSGKTEIGGAIIASYDTKTVWLTHRVALLHQTRDRLQKRLQRPIGIVGDGQVDVQQITVAMIQTITKRNGDEDIGRMLDEAKLVIGDEIHHLESKSWLSVFSRITAPHRFGLTATACTDGSGLTLIGMTGEIVAQINAKTLIDRGVLVPARIWFARVPNEVQFARKTPYPTVYSQGIVHSIPRNERVLHVARTFQAEEKNGITLVRRINHGNLLADMMCRAKVRAEFLHGKLKRDDRLRLLDRLWAGELDQIVAQDQILGEGVDMPGLETLINANGTRGGGSSRNSTEHEVGRGTIQFLGRGLRSAPGKEFFEMVDFTDHAHKFLQEASRERVRALEDEGYASCIKFWADRPA